MSGPAPHWSLDAEILLELVRPDDRAFVSIEAKQIAFGAERIKFVIGDGGRDARPSGVAYGVGAIVFALPKDIAVGFIQAEHALGAGNLVTREGVCRLLRARGNLAVHDVHAPFCHCRARVAAADGHAPAKLQPVGGKAVEDAGLSPNAIALWAQPLRPVVRAKLF